MKTEVTSKGKGKNKINLVVLDWNANYQYSLMVWDGEEHMPELAHMHTHPSSVS